jgi:hypothetical protein
MRTRYIPFRTSAARLPDGQMSSRFKPRRIHCEMHLQEVSRQLQLLVKQLHTCSDIDEKKEDSSIVLWVFVSLFFTRRDF